VCSVHGRSTSVENISQFKTGNEANDDGDNYNNDNINKNKATTKPLIIITVTIQKTVTILTNENTGPI